MLELHIFFFNNKDYRRNRNTPAKLQLLGYVTILNDCITLNQRLKDNFRAKGIEYKYLPAMKIGRLCVDDQYSGRGIGSLILAFAVRRACLQNKETACRFVTVDAKRDKDKIKDSLYFYSKYGFDVLEHKNKDRTELINQETGATPMFLDIFPFMVSKGLNINTNLRGN